jgi:kynureninase
MTTGGRVDWSAVRAQFHIPPGVTYLDGNSLGLLSRPAEAAVLAALNDWKTLGVSGWSDADGGRGWLDLTTRLAARLAPLLGALPHEVALCNQTTVNLHQMLATFFAPAAGRGRILIDDLAFPSDSYAVQSHLQLRGLDPSQHLRRVPARADGLLDEADLIAAMTPDVALALFPGVVYSTGQLLDLPRLAHAARERGITIGFDLSHSVGAVPHELHGIGADFAFGCTYKYLSAGPGSTGFLFVHERHLTRPPGLAGWFGSDRATMFDMPPDQQPALSAVRFTIGTPPILSTAPLAASLNLYEQIGIERFRARSLELTSALISLADEHLAPLGITIATPRQAHRRGGHVSLRHPRAKSLCQRLISAGIVPDYRNPDLIRLAPTPLYNTEQDLRHAVTTLASLFRSL